MRTSVALLVAVGLLAPLLFATAAGAEKAEGSKRADNAALLRAVEKAGGKVRPSERGVDEWEVEFHLLGRDLADDGLKHVAALGSVVALNLRDTKVTGAGLVHLKELKSLRRLHLERTKVGDKGFENLAGLVDLEYLNLYSTKITDKALVHLTKLRRLRRLYVWRTGVTDEGVARLQKALPKLTINRGVDVSKLEAFVASQQKPEEPKETLKFMPIEDRSEVARSQNGLNTTVFFENKSGRPVKLYWISYGNQPTLYHTLKPGEKRRQNSYSRNNWMITDINDKPLGYFRIGEEIALAVIPESVFREKK